ncbi:MAG: ATP-dependent DNA ligase, partial [Demequina sp.]
RHQERTIQYPLLNDEATVAWFAQRASLEFHVPQWRFAKGGRALPPDRLVLDLDPGEGRGLQDCARVASLARERLDDVGLVAVPVTSGSKGVHVYAALDGSRSSDEATEVAHAIAEELESTNPELVVASMDKDRRRGKVFIDWSQNRATKTTITPYSLRGRVRPWVAAPRTWAELEADDFSQLTHHDVLERIEDGNDLLAPLLGDSSHQTE